MVKKVAVVMGSDSDLDTMRPCISRLKAFGIPAEVRIISAHRTPAAAEELAAHAAENGFGVIIAAAGKAAHLAGVLAAYTTLPIIGVTQVSQVEDAAKAASLTLSEEEIARLEELGGQAGVNVIRYWEKEMK